MIVARTYTSANIYINNEGIEQNECFKYLGGTIQNQRHLISDLWKPTVYITHS